MGTQRSDKTSGDGDSSWRDTLYVWDGIMVEVGWDLVKNKEETQKSDEIPLNWKGAWVPCENCADAKKAEAPKRVGGALDVESAHHFEVSGSAKPIVKDTKKVADAEDENKTSDDEENCSTAIPHQATFTGGDGWDMGEGSDTKKYKDEVHELLLSNIKWMGNMRDQRDNLVFAKGTNEFGPFISAGWMRPGCRLTLARRYLDESDARVKWTLDDLKNNVISGIFDKDSGDVCTPPWKCDALHSDVQQPGKRKKVD
ncbi:unnamed protein product [Cylindrotheca closterium]|uniref:Uncharacterized protein n=1 Tax=Cylindrotheca closterium TaxID=2856 RepID=A0AAD2CVQ7_9STRA|nr:unnamed protein product [Cylindrotheca closterium]